MTCTTHTHHSHRAQQQQSVLTCVPIKTCPHSHTLTCFVSVGKKHRVAEQATSKPSRCVFACKRRPSPVAHSLRTRNSPKKKSGEIVFSEPPRQSNFCQLFRHFSAPIPHSPHDPHSQLDYFHYLQHFGTVIRRKSAKDER